MHRSFFDLACHAPHRPEDATSAALASYSPAELQAFETASDALFTVLHDALEAYCTAHEPTLMAVCLDATRCLVYVLERQEAVDNADA